MRSAAAGSGEKRELKNRLSEFIRTVNGGEHVLTTDRGTVVSELVPVERPGVNVAWRPWARPTIRTLTRVMQLRKRPPLDAIHLASGLVGSKPIPKLAMLSPDVPWVSARAQRPLNWALMRAGTITGFLVRGGLFRMTVHS